MAVRTRRVLGTLVSLTFDPDELIGWRAVEAMGLAAGRVARRDPQVVRNHLRRLHWLLSEESGGLCWRAPEAMAEVVCAGPELFADYVPIVALLLVTLAEEDLDHFRAAALWALGRLGPLAGEHVLDVLPAVASALDDPNPQVRGMAAWCLGQLGQKRLLEDRADLRGDGASVVLYQDRRLHRTTVGDLVRRAQG